MQSKPIPVFDANSTVHDNIGALKVVEMATRKHGDIVNVLTSHGYGMVVLSDTDSVRHWKNNQGRFGTEVNMDDFQSQSDITRIVNGDALEQPENMEIWEATRVALTRVQSGFDDWAHVALIDAVGNLLEKIQQLNGSIDLRELCARWSVSAVFPAVFGESLSAEELARGIADVEEFYYEVSKQNGHSSIKPQDTEQYAKARGFLDRVVAAALDKLDGEDGSALAVVNACFPKEAKTENRIEWLRPTLARILLEKLNVEGMGLFWALVHLAQEAHHVEDMAQELEGCNIYETPAAETPLCQAFVLESQRLYPEQPLIYRFTNRDVKINNHIIAPNTLVLFSPWLVQRDPRYWPNASRFDPKRFLEPVRDKCSYFPFGIGPRIAKRSRFMQNQVLVTVRAIISHYRLSLASNCPVGSLRPFLRSTLAPRGPVPVIFERRPNPTATHRCENA